VTETTTFEESYSTAKKLAQVRAVIVVARWNLPVHARPDLEQEGLLELWRKRAAYDAQRGSWRTFSERVVANRMTSLARRSIHPRPKQEPQMQT
jgi:DNA-directed RNA polymerase specialized sigma24 family protein